MEPRGSIRETEPFTSPAAPGLDSDEYRDNLPWRPDRVDFLKGVRFVGEKGLVCHRHLSATGLDLFEGPDVAGQDRYHPIRWGTPETFRNQGRCNRCRELVFGEQLESARWPLPF